MQLLTDTRVLVYTLRLHVLSKVPTLRITYKYVGTDIVQGKHFILSYKL